jgi:hypothetical protein
MSHQTGRNIHLVFLFFRFRFLRNRNGQIGSALTTPPNSPEPDMSSDFEFKQGKAKKKTLYRFEVIIGLFVSNLVTFMIGATIG